MLRDLKQRDFTGGATPLTRNAFATTSSVNVLGMAEFFYGLADLENASVIAYLSNIFVRIEDFLLLASDSG